MPIFLRKLLHYRPRCVAHADCYASVYKLTTDSTRVVSMNGLGIAVHLLKYLSTFPTSTIDAHFSSHFVSPISASSSQSPSKSTESPRKRQKRSISTVAKVGFLPFFLSFPTPGQSDSFVRSRVLFHCLPSSSGLVRSHQVR